MSSKLSPRQKQKLFRYAQYAILAVIALAAILLADWKTLSSMWRPSSSPTSSPWR